MTYYSTNHQAPEVSLREAVVRGLAPDRGLYMPHALPRLSDRFFHDIDRLSLHEMALHVAAALLGDDVPEDVLRRIVTETLSFDIPVTPVGNHIHSLELYHGPTLAFKDVGARFMARLLQYFIRQDSDRRPLTVLVATSGDTGSAVANGFLDVEGIRVGVLYPRGKVSHLQEMQFASLGRNVTAIAVDGTFDDCQALVKTTFMDDDLRRQLRLTSANSINLARLLPQSFYYFHAYAQLKRLGLAERLVISVPSGNFGNLAAGLFAWQMGLPVARFIAANNRNDVFFQYLRSGVYTPRPSVPTMANAMDVGAPSNFDRIQALFHHDVGSIRRVVSGATYDDTAIRETIRQTFDACGYLLDPHGACAYRALCEQLQPGEHGVFLETAHPAKFSEALTAVIGRRPDMPERLRAFLHRTKQSVDLPADFDALKRLLLSRL